MIYCRKSVQLWNGVRGTLNYILNDGQVHSLTMPLISYENIK